MWLHAHIEGRDHKTGAMGLVIDDKKSCSLSVDETLLEQNKVVMVRTLPFTGWKVRQ